MSNKYKNKRKGKYQSRKEANRAFELMVLQKAGEISNLREQVKFELIPSQKIDGKVAERPVSYFADFVYTNSSGVTIVEDTKGFRTTDYIIKRKLMLHVHGIQITEK